MKISLKWLNEWVDLSQIGNAEKIGEILTARGLEVEAIESLAQGLDKVISAKVLEKEKHPGADKLSVCKVSRGEGFEVLQIVCGAQNFKAGDTVVLSQIGAKLPNGMEIGQGKIRGVDSFGMLCSETELGMSAASEGILILPAGTPLGQPIAKILGRDDTVIELKVTPNRGDCLSVRGVARELAAATGVKLIEPKTGVLPTTASPIETALEAGEDAPQFLGCFIEGVTVGESPKWLKEKLESIGARSINNIVDVTNFVLFETGQPVHAYDAEKLTGKKITARVAKAGEKLPLLDKTEITLNGSEIVIADEAKAVSLAGVMGGGNSEVNLATKKIFLEVAEFSASHVRKASSLHSKKTDSSYRFERQTDIGALEKVLARLAMLVSEVSGGKIVGVTRAKRPSRSKEAIEASSEILFEEKFISKFLGVDLDSQELKRVFQSLSIEVLSTQGGLLKVRAPSFRRDLKIREDLAEEVARVIGFDRIPATLPALTSFPENSFEPEFKKHRLLMRAKTALVDSGLTETLSYSFDSQKWLSKFGMPGEVKLKNPLSEDQEVMVPALLPGLIKHAISHFNHTFGGELTAFRAFEIRPVFSLKDKAKGVAATSKSETGVIERYRVAIVLSGPRLKSALKNEQSEVDFYDLKSVCESFFETLGTKGVRLASPKALSEMASFFHPSRTAEILAGRGAIGWFGEIHPKLESQLKLKQKLFLAEFDFEEVAKLSRDLNEPVAFKEWSAFPPVSRDFALLVPDSVSADALLKSALKSGKPLAKSARVFDVYRGAQIKEGFTSIALQVLFESSERSLQETEIETATNAIVNTWKKELGLELRS